MILVATLAAVILLLPEGSEATKTGSVYSGGNWDITVPTVYEGEDETIDGDVIINPGASLTFGNGTLDFTATHAAAAMIIDDEATFVNAIIKHDYGTIIWTANAKTEIILSEVSNTEAHQIPFASGFNHKITSSTFTMTTVKFIGSGSGASIKVNNNEFTCPDACDSEYIIHADDFDATDVLTITNNDFDAYISLSSAAQYGVYVENGDADDDNYVWVDNNTFYYVPIGVETEAGGLRSFQNNTFTGTKNTGARIVGSQEGRINKIVNNTFEDIIYEGGEPTSTSLDAFWTRVLEDDTDTATLFMEDNTFSNIERHAMDIAFLSGDTTTDITIQNTTVDDTDIAVYYYDSTSATSQNIYIDNCSFSTATSDIHWTNPGGGSGTSHMDIYDSSITGDEIEVLEGSRTFDIYHWVNVTAVDEFFQPVASARCQIRNKNQEVQHNEFTDANGEVHWLWLLVEDEEVSYNSFHFTVSKEGEGTTTRTYPITESQEITLVMEQFEWHQTVKILPYNNYTKHPLEMGAVLVYLNGELMLDYEEDLFNETEINITVYDWFDRTLYSLSQTVNYSRSSETFRIPIEFIVITIRQYDADTKEPGSWIQEWNLTLNGTDVHYHFTGDTFSVPYVESGNNNYTLSWDYNFTNNHTGGGQEIDVKPKPLPPSTHANKNTGFMVADIGVTTTGTLSTNATPEFNLLSLEWWTWVVRQPWFFVPLALLGAIGAFLTWRMHLKNWVAVWQKKQAAQRRQRREAKEKAKQRWSFE